MRPALGVTAALALLAGTAGTATATPPGLNGSIAFTGTRIAGNPNIFTMSPAGDNETQRTTNPEADDDAAWSPDGTRFAFTRSSGGNLDIFIANADGTGVVRFTTDGGADKQPTWSPDGTRIAWVSNRLGNDDDIFSARLDGSGLIQHTSDGVFFDDEPAWSPDGSAIAFHSGRGSGGGGNIWRVSSAGTEQDVRQITTTPSEWPSWSPDGSRITFSSSRGGTQNIFSLPSGGMPEGSPAAEVDLRQHTNDAHGAKQPSWSPDGSRIAFASFRDNANWHIWSVAASGPPDSGELPLTTGPGDDTQPDWQSVAPAPVAASLSPASAAKGSGDIAITLDGSGFVRRSVVRWNGSPRSTTFVSGTRLTFVATAADLASTGTASVEVATSPVGGGTSGALTFTVTQPSLFLTNAQVEPRWRASRLRGRLRLAGEVARPATLRMRLLRPSGKGKAFVARRFRVTKAGAFARRLTLTPRLLPGRYLVEVSEVGGGAGALPTTQRATRLSGPPEGVTARAFLSTKIGGRRLARITTHPSIIFAQYTFASLPRGKKRLTVRWFAPGARRAVAVDRKPVRRQVLAFIKSRGPLPSGAWRAELRFGGTLVAIARARVG